MFESQIVSQVFQIGTRLYKDTWRSPQAEAKDDHKDKNKASKSEQEPLQEMGLMQEFSKPSKAFALPQCIMQNILTIISKCLQLEHKPA